MKQATSSNKAFRTSRIGVFAALYVITSLVPISMFIGAPSFLALNLIITPVIAILLPPLEALFASLFGGIIAFCVSPSQAMFGPYTILLPVVGATLGSLTYHKTRHGALATSIFLVGAITAYLIKNYPFPYFIVPHSVAIALTVVSTLKKMTPQHLKIPLYTYISTMTEQGMMMIFAVHLLGLPWQVFVGVLPLMIYERLVGTVGAAAVIISLLKVLPKYFTT
ncbi:MAG: hypothetical protein QW228_09580 [Candidatus Aenigmatarchaeota archaeon]